MKNILTLITITFILTSCGSGDNKSVEDVIDSRNLESIRIKKTELVSQQNLIKQEIKKLDILIAELDDNAKIPLITTFKLESVCGLIPHIFYTNRKA